ncbi:uncharacterized protein BJX67DRAFT_343924 [Aspergillus lucknowensis]|uniref:FAD-binding PCMH-type domain-containing protein n=1 Tax=Aspergillus lucknowensis TaxID=176173 RepID=A0ABR4M3T2_9EURO
MICSRIVSLLVANAALGMALNASLETLFRPVLSAEAEFFYPSWANWTENVQQRWTDYLAPTYMGAIQPATVEDIQNIVKVAVANNIPFLTTGAGHGVSAGLDRLDNGLNIDLSKFRYAELDETGYYLTIGGATKFLQVWDVLYAAGKEVQTGAADCVGSIGATLGAGIGPLQGHLGLMIDALESVKLVTATGDLVTASKTENEELFWGLRGAGWNFGIVVEATYQVFDATNNGQVLEGDMQFPASVNQSIWENLKALDETLPEILSITLILSYNAETDESAFTVNFIYFGPEEEAQPYLQPFYDLQPTRSNFTVVPWNILYSTLYFGADSAACKENNHLFNGGAGVTHIDVDAFTAYTTRFTDFWRDYPGVTPAVVFSRFPNQAVRAVPDEETAYPYRDISTHIYFEDVFEDDPANEEAVYDFLVESRDHFTKTSGFRNLTLYNNYAQGDEGPEILYTSRKLPRLAALKRKWDPNEVFSYYNPVPVHWP